MDAFFAGVEMRSDPRLARGPMVVGGGPGKRGVVTAASYAARPFGIRSGMSLGEAFRLCPDLLVVPVDPSKMIHESIAVMGVLDRFSPRVEPASIDEAYLDLDPRAPEEWERVARSVGEAIRATVLRERGLSCSVGAGVSRVQAKMASPRGKPGGVTVVAPGSFLDMFGGESVRVIPGVGPRTAEALEVEGVLTIRDLSRAEEKNLRRATGAGASYFRDAVRGGGDARVLAFGESGDPKSAGHEMTFGADVTDPDVLRGTLLLLADRVARRLRKGGLLARTAAVRFKIGKQRFSRQKRLGTPTDRYETLAGETWPLLETARRGRPLRLVGIAGCDLTRSVVVGDLLAEDDRRTRGVETEDRLRDRFGEDVLLPATVHLRGGAGRRRALGWNPAARERNKR